MKVLHFYKTYFPDSMGGVQQLINQLARGMSDMGIETTVLSLSRSKQDRILTIDGHAAHRAPLLFEIASTGFSTAVFSHFRDLLEDADLVHYHYPWPFMDLVHFITRVKKPTLVTYHADIIRQKYLLTCYRPLQQRFLKSVDAIVATSPQYLATSPVLQQFQDKTRIIPIGLDKSTYPTPTAERLSYWQQQFGTRFFLFVGVLRYYKGLGVLLEAARHNTYPIVILGSGPIESDLKKQANRLGLKHVHFLGQLSDLDKTALLTLCGAFIFPSNLRSEAFGIALLEAAMFGKPLISCDIGSGMSYINKPDETGLEVPANDPEALHRAMTWLWENPDEAYKLGKQAQARYESLFTTTQMVDAYTALYREITL